MPNNAIITSCSWNRKEGYVAAGSEGGLIKIIKLEMTDGLLLFIIKNHQFGRF